MRANNALPAFADIMIDESSYQEFSNLMEPRKPIDRTDDPGNVIEMFNRGRFECETGLEEHEALAHEERRDDMRAMQLAHDPLVACRPDSF